MKIRVNGGLITLAIIVAILAVSTASIFIRLAQKEAPSLVIATLRLTFSTLMLAPIALTRYKGELKSFSRADWLLALFSGFFLAIHFATWITSLSMTSIASSVVLVSTGPLWVAIFSPIFLKEAINRRTIIGLSLAFLGGVVISLSGMCTINKVLICSTFSQNLNKTSLLGDLLALFGAFAVAGYLILGRKLRSRVSLIPYIFVVYGMSAFVLAVFMTAARQSPFGLSGMTYLWIFLLALLPQIIGHSTYNWALKYLSATLVAVGTLGEPIGSTILAYFILKETPGILELSGGLFILIGIFIALFSPKVKPN